jgi:hypothetical protein
MKVAPGSSIDAASHVDRPIERKPSDAQRHWPVSPGRDIVAGVQPVATHYL